MHCKKHGDLHAFQVDDDKYYTRITRKFRERDAWERPDPREVHSYIPGMVIRVVATEGDRLKAGEPLLTFEAMKMENTLTMPCDGVVRKVHVKVGDVFAKDIIVAEIEPA